MPAASRLSLTVNGTPWSGPAGSRRASASRARASARSPSTWTTALTRGFDLLDPAQVRLDDLGGGGLAVADRRRPAGGPARPDSPSAMPYALEPHVAGELSPPRSPTGPRTAPRDRGSRVRPRPARHRRHHRVLPGLPRQRPPRGAAEPASGVRVRGGDGASRRQLPRAVRRRAAQGVRQAPRGAAELWLDDALLLNVSDRAMEILREFNLRRCDISKLSRSGSVDPALAALPERLAELGLEHLAGARLGQRLVAEVDLARELEAGDALAAVRRAGRPR